MEVVGFLTGIISLVVLIVFFFMASNLRGIRKDTASIKRILGFYAERDGYFWTCPYCNASMEESRTICLGCGEEKPSKSKKNQKSKKN